MDDELVMAIRNDYTRAPITPEERTMLDYVVKVTCDANGVRQDDLDKLRRAGFDDTGLLQINLLTSLFNYLNRVADGLGVGRDS